MLASNCARVALIKIYILQVVIVVVANKTKELDSTERDSSVNRVLNWCSREKMKHFSVNAMHRSTLYEPFVYLTSKLNPAPSKSTFPQLSMGRKALAKDFTG